MTREALQSTLQQPYQRERWGQTLRSVLPGTELFTVAQPIAATTTQAREIHQLGRIRLAGGRNLAALEIILHPGVDLVRNRVGLRQLLSRFIDQAEYHGVLAVFLTEHPGYRFTFAASESIFDTAGQITRVETTPRRYTYILGPGEACRTPAERFAQLAAKGSAAALSDVIDAFSVDKLNKEFFADFCRAFEHVSADIQRRHPAWPDAIVERAAQTLLDRLVFLYFVQRKGWLNRQRDYLHGHFRDHLANHPQGTTYHAEFLRPLFVKLSTEGPQADIAGHDLPFLNGGLFSDEYGDEQHDDTSRRHNELTVGNDTFHFVFENLLERYNFTIHEDSPSNQEVAIDPEMLGKIFESLVLQIEQSGTGGKSLRHDTGSHYTPRPIVHYLCREALAAWLENQKPVAADVSRLTSSPVAGPLGQSQSRLTSAATSDWPARIAKLLALDASDGIDDAERQTLAECLTPEEASQLLDRLFDLRACDPAVGSGAFAMGLLRELLNLARLCEARARGRDPIEGDRAWLYETKKRLIERVIYGVDLQERAVEICKLRLWLSLLVDHDLGVEPADCDARAFRKALKALEPLPNLDFKIRRANSLVDHIHGEPVHLSHLSRETGAAVPLSRLTTAKREFFNAHTAAAKRHLRLDIYEALTDLAKIELTRARTDAAGFGLALDEKATRRVAELDHGLKEMAFITAQVHDTRKLRAAQQDEALERIRAHFEDPQKPTFVWQLDFAEVFHRSVGQASRLSPTSPAAAASLALESPADGDRRDASPTSGGFDIVLANPPYVRQELLAPYKPWLEAHYETFHGMADLYVYFYELGVRILQPGGVLSYIVTNKWMKAGYGEPLRRFFSQKAWVRSVVDFGHAKQIFPEADVFPSILVVQKPTEAPKPKTARLCIIPREQLRIDDLTVQVEKEGAELETSQLSAEAWSLEPKSVDSLLTRIRKGRRTLKEAAGIAPLYGIKTGLNEAFLIDGQCRRKLIAEHDGCREIIKPFLRGSDVGRWSPDWDDLWMIVLASSNDRAWPWADSGRAAEAEFKARYPSLHGHFKPLEGLLRKRQDQGKYWWELRPCAYWEAFSKDKLVYQVIQYHPRYAFDEAGRLGNDKTYFLPTADAFLLAVLNSPLMWWHNWRTFTHLKDEALSPMAYMVETLPIAEPTTAIRAAAETAVHRLIEITVTQQQTQRTLLDWLRVEYAIEKPGNKLQDMTALDSDTLVSEVKRVRGRAKPLTTAGVQALRAEYTRTLVPARALAAETLKLECALSDLVNQAYGLTPEEIALMWQTAPPRMPIPPPQ